MRRKEVCSCQRFEVEYLPVVWAGGACRAPMSLLQRYATADDHRKL